LNHLGARLRQPRERTRDKYEVSPGADLSSGIAVSFKGQTNEIGPL
jgi:hypothetical protein